MTRLLTKYLRPYGKQISFVLVLLLIQAIANLYLPELNADIINNGVAKGDTAYIVSRRRAHARRDARPRGRLGRRGLLGLQDRRWRSGATCGARSSARSRLLADRGQPLRHAVAHHPQHQRRAAGADGRRHGAHRHDLGADHGRRRHHHGAAPGRAAVRPARHRPAAHGRRHRPADDAGDPAVPGDAGQDRPHQPGHARDARRRPRHPRVRADRARGAAVRRGQPRPHRHRAQGQPALRADDPGAHGDPEPLDRRGHVVRQHPRRQRGDADRQPDRLPHLHHADPHVGDDGDDHVRHGAARGRLGRAHPGGARHRAVRARTPRCRRSRSVRRGSSSSATSSSATRAPRTRSCATSRSRPGPARRRRSSAAPAAASRRSSTSSRASTTSPPAPSSSTASTSARCARRTSGARSASSRRRRSCSAGRSPATCATATRRRPTSELWHALEIAQARDFVAEMPDGLEAPITQGGTNVSGGQRQRLAIARALVKRPEIYVFDDSFSALDFKTDARLRAALKQETGAATVIIVAQRVSTIMHADRIVVMDDGTVVGHRHARGAHGDCETYREIVYSQLTRGGGRVSERTGAGGRPGMGGGARWAARACRATGRAPAPGRLRRRPARHGHDAAGREVEGLPRLVRAAARASCGRKRRRSSLVIVLAVVSVAFAVVGPKILGNATNVLFEGVVGKQMPAGVTQEQAVAALRAQRPGPARRHARRACTSRPAQGVDFAALGQHPAAARRRLPAERALRLGAGLHHGRRRPADRLPAAPARSTRSSARLPLQLLRRPPARRHPEPRHQRHRQHRPDAPAEPDPDHHLAAHDHRRAGHDVLRSARCWPSISLLAVPALDRRHDAHRQALAEAVRGPVGSRPARSTATSRRCTPGTPS